MSLLTAIAAALPSPEGVLAPSSGSDSSEAGLETSRDAPDRGAQGMPAKPVLQFVPVPVTLDPRQFAGALSNENPGGSSLRLRAFRNLVDPLPGFSSYYTGQSSTEQVYNSIVQGAVAQPDNTFAQQIIADCKKRLSDTAFPTTDGTVGAWCPVYASPCDWADDLDPSRFSDLEIDLSDDDGGAGPYAFVGSAPSLRLQTASGPVALQPGTSIKALRFKYLVVVLERPWMNSTLFATSGWRVPMQRAGFCSNGTLASNDGVMPLVPTALLLGRDISLDADWSATDRALIDQSATLGVSLGPIPLGTPPPGPSLQVVAWISALTPLSPAMSGEGVGSVLAVNRGAFTARFSLNWQRGAQAESQRSPNILALQDCNLAVPAGASNIVATVEVMTSPPPKEKWKTADVVQWASTGVRRLELSGAVNKPVVAVVYDKSS